MQYRIRFHPGTSKFRLEILVLWSFWVPAKLDRKIQTFDTFENAKSYVASIGLDKVYSDRTHGFDDAVDPYRGANTHIPRMQA